MARAKPTNDNERPETEKTEDRPRPKDMNDAGEAMERVVERGLTRGAPD